MMKILKFATFLYALICFGQNRVSEEVYQSTIDRYQKPFKISDENKSQGKLSLSKTEDEISKTCMPLFIGYYFNGKFSNSIFYAKKADVLFLKSNKTEEHFIASYYLSLSYQKSGFTQKAAQYQNEAEKTAQKLGDPYFIAMALKLKANSLENEKKFREAIPYLISYNVSFPESLKKDSQHPISEFTFSKCYLAFDYLMMDNLAEAKKQILLFESNNDTWQISNQLNWRSEIYYVCKAVIAAKENDKINAANYFDKAIDITINNGMDDRLTAILEQRLKLNIDASETREKLFAEFIKRRDNSRKEIFKVVNQEMNGQGVILERQKEYKYIFIGVALFLSTGVLLFKRRKRKKQKIYFEEIIKDLENNKEKENSIVIDEEINNDIAADCPDSKSHIILESTKKDLLKKLERFEKGNAFTAKNFTVSCLVSILDTNPKYIVSIIKEHYGKTFNEYINDLRIKYILEYLHDNPESLKYKLTYLSELGGFSSHSYFTKVFTKKNKISPSKFILALNEKNINEEIKRSEK